jgi:predicted O-methyltransferase YrrM
MAFEIEPLTERGRQVGLFYPHGVLTTGTIFAHARRPETRQRLIDALRRTQSDDVDEWRRQIIEAGLEKFGADWDYLDNVCVAHSFAELAKPRRVLEIGVRRGLSTFAIGAGAPDAELFLNDLWIENYGHRVNPGPDAIKPGLLAVGHHGRIEFHSGDSHAVIPSLLAQRPDLMFDLILVDGDHTEAGALEDLKNVFPRLAPGGMLVFDDIAHPVHHYLLGLWRRCIGELGLRVRCGEYLDHGHGVAIALRAY